MLASIKTSYLNTGHRTQDSGHLVSTQDTGPYLLPTFSLRTSRQGYQPIKRYQAGSREGRGQRWWRQVSTSTHTHGDYGECRAGHRGGHEDGVLWCCGPTMGVERGEK